jgi:hypothetical protein
MFELPLLAYGYGQAAIGGWHCLAVDEDGRAYAWGGNEYGQCAKELDRKGVDKVLHRDISIPQRCCPRLRVRQVFPPSFSNGYATLVLS